MKQYHELLSNILDTGDRKQPARANMPGSISLFGAQLEHDFSQGFPLLTTKRMGFNSVVVELLWFMSGRTNVKWLVDRGVQFWNEDAYAYYCRLASANSDQYNDVMLDNGDGSLRMYTFDEFSSMLNDCTEEALPRVEGYVLGDCGNQYGKTWRNLDGSYDQLAKFIEQAKTNPESRRHVLSSIDAKNDEDLALYWCHSLFQLNFVKCTHEYRKNLYLSDPKFPTIASTVELTESYLDEHKVPRYFIDSKLYQRSADVFLGVPMNIASYALLTHIVAMMTNTIPRKYIHTFGDVHIYTNHIDAVETQLARSPYNLPRLNLSRLENFDWSAPLDQLIDNLIARHKELKDKCLIDYQSHPAIRAVLSTGITK